MEGLGIFVFFYGITECGLGSEVGEVLLGHGTGIMGYFTLHFLYGFVVVP